MAALVALAGGPPNGPLANAPATSEPLLELYVDRFEEMRVFAAVAQLQSFSVAARQLIEPGHALFEVIETCRVMTGSFAIARRVARSISAERSTAAPARKTAPVGPGRDAITTRPAFLRSPR